MERDTRYWPSDVQVGEVAAADLPAIIERYLDGLAPHAPEAFERAMMEISVVYPQSRTSEVEQEARFAAYATALEDIPSDLLLKAARLAVRHCEFFPRPAELRKLIEEDMIERRGRLNRAMLLARRLVGAHEAV